MPFIKEIWNETTELQRDVICSSQLLNSVFIEKIWKELTKKQRNEIMFNGKESGTLSDSFIEEIWDELTECQQDDIQESIIQNKLKF